MEENRHLSGAFETILGTAVLAVKAGHDVTPKHEPLESPAPEQGGQVEESLKDLSTTVVGLLAAYLMPGVIVIGLLAWHKDSAGDFFLRDGTHLVLGLLTAFAISLILNGVRVALFSRWLFKELTENLAGYKGLNEGKLKVLQGIVDEVFRLHQFYSALFFLFPIAFWYCATCLYGRLSPFMFGLLILGGIVFWRMIAASALDQYEFYYQVARGALGVQSAGKEPGTAKAWIISGLFDWTFWRKYETPFR